MTFGDQRIVVARVVAARTRLLGTLLRTAPASLASSSPGQQPLPWRRLQGCRGYVEWKSLTSWLALWTVLSAVSVMVSGVSGELCQGVQNRCFTRDGCRLALQNYWTHCTLVTNGAVDHCAPECAKALIMLLTSEEQGGEDFVNCDCEDEEFCLQQKTRIEICHREVQAALHDVNDDVTRISCDLAASVCVADTECLKAFEFYDRHCKRMFRGEGCPARCNNSLNILFRQRKANKLRNCYCDGDDVMDCSRERTHMARLCFHREPHGGAGSSHHVTTTPRMRHPGGHDHERDDSADGDGDSPPLDDNSITDNGRGCNPQIEISVVGSSLHSGASHTVTANTRIPLTLPLVVLISLLLTSHL